MNRRSTAVGAQRAVSPSRSGSAAALLGFFALLGMAFPGCSSTDSPALASDESAAAATPRSSDSAAASDPMTMGATSPADAITQVGEESVLATALRPGQTAPDFSLPVAGGGTLRLSETLERGPVVLTWYRGGWCPYCTRQLQGYSARMDEFRRRGATVVAIGPEVPSSALDTAEETEVLFPVLSDRGNVVAARYGVGYRLTQSTIDRYTGRLDVPGHNGDASWTLPLSVTYVIDRDRTIRWARIDPDYRQRAETDDILAALDELGSTSGD